MRCMVETIEVLHGQLARTWYGDGSVVMDFGVREGVGGQAITMETDRAAGGATAIKPHRFTSSSTQICTTAPINEHSNVRIA